MSILKEPYATPSRVQGVVRYLLQARGKRENRDTLMAILSPTSLANKGNDNEPSRNMVRATIRECIKIGLLVESQDKEDLALNPKLKLENNFSLPFSLPQFLFNNPEHTGNYDFAKILAWNLAQDFFNAPGNWQEAEQKLQVQVGSDLLELNDVCYEQFKDWSCYMGFSWINTLLGTQVLVPDPTAYLRQNLKHVFGSRINQRIPLGEFINQLGKHCPVFEMGRFREEIEKQIGLQEPNHLSTVTSIALRRLEEENLLKLERLSDNVDIWILGDGYGNLRYSHISWIESESKEENNDI
jgi:hypothetical protein